MGQDKDNKLQLLSQAKQTLLGENSFNVLPVIIGLAGEEQRQKL